MLTADLVRVQKRNGELKLLPLDAKRRARAEEIAAAYLEIFETHLGLTREELEESLEAIEVDPRDRVLARGLQKLLEDRAELDAEHALDPVDVRARVFALAASRRRELGADETFDRTKLLEEVAKELSTDVAELERSLYADLRGAHLLKSFSPIAPAALVEAYVTGRAQAVLLRAARVRVDVLCASPASYRALFQKLKFLRLLYVISPLEGGGYRLEIDGPMSLFGPVTKYGLELAMFLPVLEGAEYFELEADVRWTGGDELLLFKTKGGLSVRDELSVEDAKSGLSAALGDDVRSLLERIQGLESDWKVAVAEELLELPGVGVVVPDLVLTKKKAKVFVEVMGHWSRSAVWRRVELVEQGLGAPIVFAVSTRLRVSEEALPEGSPGALYVYKGTMSAKAVLEKVEAVAAARKK